jgi:23S rRNA (cytidine1920-2'-O)/16S rRNA (cytidine1409-2'-O)-methyltransferase
MVQAKKMRLDQVLVDRGLVDSREKGQRLIMAGEVLVNDRVADKAGMPIALDASIQIKEPLPYVSRGGLKLAAALDRFSVPVVDVVCADVGASTGGFTDCLLQRGAAKVYAIDVGYGQLDWKLRRDPRVVVMDRVNARYVEALPEPIGLAVIDASFISLRLILLAVLKWLRVDAHVVALIKPQFEAGRDKVGKGGVVRAAEVHAEVLRSIWTEATTLGFSPIDLIRSPVRGPAGNIEFLIWLRPAQNAPQNAPQQTLALTIQHVLSLDEAQS